ncbi:MAG TPA: AsmA-like C-terminal region-containing protein, partial [Candidatus Binatia bacterium]|nr:AsmA-like C-terminal region-containing protein [Candidatus Binatia bacterium]
RSIMGGRVTDTTLRLDIRPDDLADGVLSDEAVDVRFNVADGALRFLTTMSPVTHINGSAIVRGNRFDMTAASARINNLVVRDGRVEIPRFKPKGELATISARADGAARNMIELLLQEPLGLGDRLPIEAASVTGTGSVTLRLQRPMLREVPFENWRFTVNGAIRDFAGNMSARRVALSQGQLSVRGDQRAVTVSGPIRAGTSQIQNVRWTENIIAGRRGRSSSEYQISGDFDANDLERLGYPVARYAQGRIGVTVSGEGRGFDVDNARIDLDLTNAAIEAPRQFWTKRAGQAASARFNVQRQSDGGLLFTDLDARGAGLNAQGRVRLTRDERIQEADLTRLVIEGRSDARLTATRAADGGLDVNVRGALFDAAPFMGSERQPEGATPTATRAPPAPLRASVVVSRLKMRGGATMSNARVNLTMLRGALAMLTAEGQSPRNGAFSLALGPRPDDPQGRIRMRSEDAGFAVAALTGMDNIIGGSASADGDWRGGPPSQARFNVSMRDFNVVRLPAMAQLLSSAGSLTGLVDTLNGDGIGFSVMEAQMAYANDRVTFTEGAMRGPAMGLTGSGSYDIARDNLDVDGVVAPSPLLNLSMLGEVPVIGNLLVSRRGEGVFGMTYAINGEAAQPRVGVNPVSALTPGILRRIFEPPQPRDAGGSHSLPPPDPEAVAAARAAAAAGNAQTANAAPLP